MSSNRQQPPRSSSNNTGIPLPLPASRVHSGAFRDPEPGPLAWRWLASRNRKRVHTTTENEPAAMLQCCPVHQFLRPPFSPVSNLHGINTTFGSVYSRDFSWSAGAGSCSLHVWRGRSGGSARCSKRAAAATVGLWGVAADAMIERELVLSIGV